MPRCQANATERLLDVAFFLDNKAKTTKQTNKQFLQTQFLSHIPANLEVLALDKFHELLDMKGCPQLHSFYEDNHRRCHSLAHDARSSQPLQMEKRVPACPESKSCWSAAMACRGQ